MFFIKYKNQVKEADVSTNANKRVMDIETHPLKFDTLILEDDYRDEFNYIYEHLSEIEIPESTEEKDTISKFDLTALSDEMKQLLETLTPAQEEILHIILSQENMSQRIEEIANAEMSII